MTSLVDIIRKECVQSTPYMKYYEDTKPVTLFTYGEELAGSYIRGPSNTVYYFLPSERKNSVEMTKQLKNQRPRPKTQLIVRTAETYKSPVYKPHHVGVFYEEHYQGPQSINSEPLIEAIQYKNKTLYFGIINQKVAVYSISLDQNGKKKMDLYQVNKILAEDQNRLSLKQFALSFLSELRKQDKQAFEAYQASQQSVSEYDYAA